MKRLVAGITVLLALLAAAARVDPSRGLNGTYSRTPTGASQRRFHLDPADQRSSADAWHGMPPEHFTASWAFSS